MANRAKKSYQGKLRSLFRDKKRVTAYGIVLLLLFALLGLFIYRSRRESALITVTAPDGNGSVTLRRSDYEKSLQDTHPLIVDGSTLHPCTGNHQDQCKGSPSIDFWPGGSEAASNPNFVVNPSETPKEIMGRITAVNGQSLVIKTTSGRSFTINFPLDPVNEFNTTRSGYFNGVQVGFGDMLHVDYSEAADQHATTISVSHLSRSQLLLKDMPTKADVNNIQKY